MSAVLAAGIQITPALRRPRHRHIARDPLGVRHQHGKTPVRRGDSRQALRAAVGVIGILLSACTSVIDKMKCPAYLFQIALPGKIGIAFAVRPGRSEEHTSDLQSLMRISYAVFCLK